MGVEEEDGFWALSRFVKTNRRGGGRQVGCRRVGERCWFQNDFSVLVGGVWVGWGGMEGGGGWKEMLGGGGKDAVWMG